MRCVHTILGFGCGNEAESGQALCAVCKKIVYGPMWKDPVYGPMIFGVVLAGLAFVVLGIAVILGCVW